MLVIINFIIISQCDGGRRAASAKCWLISITFDIFIAKSVAKILKRLNKTEKMFQVNIDFSWIPLGKVPCEVVGPIFEEFI